MPRFNYDLIVIGAGAGGLTAAIFAAQSTAKTLLVEKEEKLGGDCLHYGCVPSKSLIKSANVYHTIRNAQEYGLPPAAVAPVDYRRVAERIQAIIDTIQPHDDPKFFKERYGIDTKFGSPRFLDANTIELNGERISSRYFVIATGSSALIPPVDGLAEAPFITNTEIFRLDKLPQTMIVMGGGPIGLEMAQAFGRLGSKVTVLEAMDKFLPKEDPDVASFIKETLEKEGVEILLSTVAGKVEYENNEFIITLENKQTNFKQVIKGDTLLVSAGRQANVRRLDLQNAGVEFTSRMIKVNDRMQTTAQNIYAVGDVAGGYQFTHVASYEASIAVYNAILKIPKKTDYTMVPWVTYLDPEVASIGYNEQRAKEAGIRYTTQITPLTRNDRALAEGENRGFIKMLVNSRGRVIGVQIVGYHAGDLIGEWLPVFNAKLKLSAVAGAVHPYPTMGEINRNVSVAYLVSRIPSWIKKIIKLIFGYQGKA